MLDINALRQKAALINSVKWPMSKEYYREIAQLDEEYKELLKMRVTIGLLKEVRAEQNAIKKEWQMLNAETKRAFYRQDDIEPTTDDWHDNALTETSHSDNWYIKNNFQIIKKSEIPNF